MSTTALRKSIGYLDVNQLRELIVDLYEAKCDSRYYLDFFVNPDIDSRLVDAQGKIDKELKRGSRGISKARISVVKKAIASISCLNPGSEHCLRIMVYAVESLCRAARIHSFRDPLVKSVCKLLHDTIIYADRNQLLDTCLPSFEKTIAGIPSPFYRPNHLKQELTRQLQTTLQEISL